MSEIILLSLGAYLTLLGTFFGLSLLIVKRFSDEDAKTAENLSVLAGTNANEQITIA